MMLFCVDDEKASRQPATKSFLLLKGDSLHGKQYS
jgi:hypothetical protein